MRYSNARKLLLWAAVVGGCFAFGMYAQTLWGVAYQHFFKPQAPAAACGEKRTCDEMESCEEAHFYLEQCGIRGLDRDKDGVPCETICPN